MEKRGQLLEIFSRSTWMEKRSRWMEKCSWRQGRLPLRDTWVGDPPPGRISDACIVTSCMLVASSCLVVYLTKLGWSSFYNPSFYRDNVVSLQIQAGAFEFYNATFQFCNVTF
jgi:hypothetical protein